MLRSRVQLQLFELLAQRFEFLALSFEVLSFLARVSAA